MPATELPEVVQGLSGKALRGATVISLSRRKSLHVVYQIVLETLKDKFELISAPAVATIRFEATSLCRWPNGHLMRCIARQAVQDAQNVRTQQPQLSSKFGACHIAFAVPEWYDRNQQHKLQRQLALFICRGETTARTVHPNINIGYRTT